MASKELDLLMYVARHVQIIDFASQWCHRNWTVDLKSVFWSHFSVCIMWLRFWGSPVFLQWPSSCEWHNSCMCVRCPRCEVLRPMTFSCWDTWMYTKCHQLGIEFVRVDLHRRSPWHPQADSHNGVLCPTGFECASCQTVLGTLARPLGFSVQTWT